MNFRCRTKIDTTISRARLTKSAVVHEETLCPEPSSLLVSLFSVRSSSAAEPKLQAAVACCLGFDLREFSVRGAANKHPQRGSRLADG